MKTIISILLFLLSPQIFSQNIEYITGRTIDNNSIAIEGVAIIMQKADSSFISGTITDKDGRFRIKSVTKPYRLIFQHISYSVTQLMSSKDNIGDVVLDESSTSLNEVAIKAEKPMLKMYDNRLTYDISTIQNRKVTSNAHELLKELPSITSLDGNTLTLVGSSNTTIIISGKISHLNYSQLNDYLKTIPSEEVERVEILYNAPPQWHVKGSVINVILKKRSIFSLNGQIQGNWINQHRNSFDIAGSTFLTSPKWNVDMIYKFSNNKNINKTKSKGLHSVAEAIYEVETNTQENTHNDKHSLYTNVEYKINSEASLELTYNALFTPRIKSELYSMNSLFSNANSLNNGDDALHNIALSYRSQKGFSAGFEYTDYANSDMQKLGLLNDNSFTDAFSYERKQHIKKTRAYIDLLNTLKNNWTISYGVNYNNVSNTNNQKNVDYLNNGYNDYVKDFQTKEHTATAYLGIQKSFWKGKLSFDISLAGELYKINDYKTNTLLPNLTITYVPTNNHIFQLTYNSLRTYPSYWQRQDYTSYSDEYTVSMGNPMLKPARTANINMAYILKSKYIFQISYYHVKDFFIEQSFQSPTILQLLYKTFNIDYTSNLNFTSVIPVNINKIFSTNIVTSIYNEKYKSKDWFGLNYDRSKWTGSIITNNTFTISQKPKIAMTLMAFYRTPTIQGIWNLKNNWGINAGVRYSFANDCAILGLQCNDILQSMYPKIEVRFDKQHQDINQNFFNRSFTISFTYKFKGYKGDKQEKQVDTSRFGIN